MDAIELMRIMGEDFRVRFHKDELDYAILYFINMIKDNRVVIIYEDKLPFAIMTYSLTDDSDTFLKKETWDYLPHNLLAKTVYVEKLISKGWNKGLRLAFEKTITSMYPKIEQGIWHRYGKYGDRCVISKRRLQNV